MNSRKKLAYEIIVICFFLTISSVIGAEVKMESELEIKLIFEDAVLTATMQNNSAARDFIRLLPLSLTLEDYAATEKISRLPQKLSAAGTPAGFDPSVGDITYYAPWGNLAVFYRDFGYANGLIHLGKIDSDMQYFAAWKGSRKVRIELAK